MIVRYATGRMRAILCVINLLFNAKIYAFLLVEILDQGAVHLRELLCDCHLSLMCMIYDIVFKSDRKVLFRLDYRLLT
jgi:hypothetical protein